MNINLNLGNGVLVRNSIVSDIKPIAEGMRKSDKDEIWVSSRHSPLEALTDGYRKSIICYTVLYNNIPVAMFGCAPKNLLGDTAIVWLLATTGLCNCRREFLRYDRVFVKYMLSYYSHLSNMADMRNKESIKWLRRLGAKISEAVPFGKEGLLFHPFSFDRGN